MQKQEIVEKYLARLNLKRQEPNYDFLVKIMKSHLAIYPFANVGCLLGDVLPLDLTSLFQRIVIDRRGGYCFEHNALFFEVLDNLGFKPALYLGRVIYDQKTHPPLTHRLSIVEIDGEQYVVDVGFGFQGPALPIPLSGKSVKDEAREFRVEKRNATDFHLQINKEGKFFSLYRFELANYGEADCDVGHFYSHKYPDSIFVNRLVGSVIKEQAIHSLVDLDYRVTCGSTVQESHVQDANELKEILQQSLHLEVSIEECRQLFDRCSKTKI